MNKVKVNLPGIAFRNLARHKVKTVLTILAIAIGVSLYNWMDCWLLGMNMDSRRNLVNYETGSAKIYSKAYFEKKDELPMYESFDNYKPIINKLNEVGYNAAPHEVFAGSLMSVDQELPFLFIGIDPNLEKNVLKYYNFLEGEDSRFVQNGKFEAMIGVKGAKDLNVKVGDRVRCSVTIDIKDEIGKVRHIHQLIELTISGIINSPNPKTNGYIAYLPLDILQDEKGILLDGHITEILIREKNASEVKLPGKFEEPEYIRKKLGDTLPDNLVVVGWQEDAKDYLAISAGDKYSTYIMIAILLILATMGITNTMLMAIYERTKEIGMIRAIGMKDNDILKLFLLEAGFIGLIGSIIGLILALPLDIYTIYVGIDYTNIMEKANMTDFGYRVIGIFKGAWNIITIILSPIFATLISALAAFIPALKAVKIPIVECLRFE